MYFEKRSSRDIFIEKQVSFPFNSSGISVTWNHEEADLSPDLYHALPLAEPGTNWRWEEEKEDFHHFRERGEKKEEREKK